MIALTSSKRGHGARSIAWAAMIVLFAVSAQDLHARPAPKGKKGGAEPQSFLRQTNLYSNLEFFYTNRGVLFNSGVGQNEGLFWPRGSGGSYVFGEGLWFATQKLIQGKRRKLAELGYNPNSGAGWYIEGEASQVGLTTGTYGATPAAKYISYVGPRYDRSSGKFIPGSSSVVPAPYYPWPLWDTSTTKTLNHNFYFGDYISNETMRGSDKLTKNGSPAKPAITSEEDIVNVYTDKDFSNNPEYRAGTGYPFGLDIQEEIYSWSFGRYRDMIFLRQKVTNSSQDTLIDCWMSPAFDPDLDAAVGGANNDANSYVNDSLVKSTAAPDMVAQLRQPYRSNATKLNMGVQWRNYTAPPNGKQYGWIGFSFLESPVIDSSGNIVANDDSASLHGYGPGSLFQKNEKGLVTFKDWIILNDPSTQDLRYDFISSGSHDLFNGVYQDQRLLMATGPFTMLPGKSAETVVAMTIAQVDNIDYKKNFGALLLLTDFAHQVFGEVDSSVISVVVDTSGKKDTTWGYFVNHFLSPVPPAVPNVKTTALDKAVLVTWDTVADFSVDPVSGLHSLALNDPLRKDTTLAFMGYQLWRTSRRDHDSTVRPDGTNPNVLLRDWHLYDFANDSVFDKNNHFNHFHHRRTNSVPHAIPHSYLDVGDDNHDGQLTGNEGLLNGVQYYYYVIAYDEYDSINQIGPLYTAIVPPKNFVLGIPNRPVLLTAFSGDTTADIAGNCLAGSNDPLLGGLKDVRLNIVDTGIFAKLFTNDVIKVSFQPRWSEFNTLFLNQSPLYLYADVTDNTNGIQNTYKKLQNPAANTLAYYFPLPPTGTIVYHQTGTITADSVFPAQFTTASSTFSPNQTIDNAFSILADINFEQLSAPYRLSAVHVTPGPGNSQLDTNILRLSRRTNNGSDGSTRPSFLGGLGETAYEVTFDNPIQRGPMVLLTSGDTLYPHVLPIHVRIAGCPQAELRHVQDTAKDMTTEFDAHFYSSTGKGTNGLQYPTFNDPDTMHVPNPGWYEMSAFHYTDAAAFDQPHTNASFDGQGPTSGATVGPYYFPIGGTDNSKNGVNHLVVHKLSVGGAEIIFNAPEIPSAEAGDTIGGNPNIPNHGSPHTNDFQPGDKITLSFTGMVKNLPFPGAEFTIKTESGSKVDFSQASNYTDSVLAQVQVVPNPYIVTHLGQTSTDNAKLFFTRLPPRATIEIYTLDGTLVNTLEHIGYQSTITQDPSNPAQTITNYNGYSQLSDQSSVETWNLLTSGKQRVGSQVLFARVIARDPNSGKEIAETVTKFAVVVGISK